MLMCIMTSLLMQTVSLWLLLIKLVAAHLKDLLDHTHLVLGSTTMMILAQENAMLSNISTGVLLLISVPNQVVAARFTTNGSFAHLIKYDG